MHRVIKYLFEPHPNPSPAEREQNALAYFVSPKWQYLNRVSLIIIFSTLSFCKNLVAQNNAARYEIDAKRMGVNYYDKDALPRC